MQQKTEDRHQMTEDRGQRTDCCVPLRGTLYQERGTAATTPRSSDFCLLSSAV
ncbi:MAG: hypothetical protein HY936_10380 [Nitrosomonadales bacterium]|nr:hypothetical protein [Nitrosomonadales bacterium]